MDIIKLYAELQTNPRNTSIYEKIANYYRTQKMENEANAFLELIEKKTNANSTHIDKQ